MYISAGGCLLLQAPSPHQWSILCCLLQTSTFSPHFHKHPFHRIFSPLVWSGNGEGSWPKELALRSRVSWPIWGDSLKLIGVSWGSFSACACSVPVKCSAELERSLCDWREQVSWGKESGPWCHLGFVTVLHVQDCHRPGRQCAAPLTWLEVGNEKKLLICAMVL